MKPSILKLFLAFALVTLTACETQRSIVEEELPPVAIAQKITPQQASLSEEAEQQLLLAEDSDNPAQKLNFRLQATRLYLDAGKIELAKHQLNIIRTSYENMTASETAGDAAMDETLTTDILLVATRISIAEKNTTLAHQTISDIVPVTRRQQIEYYELKSDIDYLSTRYFFSIDRRIQLATYLNDKTAILKNNRKIWASLSNMTNAQLQNQYTDKPVFNGWLKLAAVMRSGQSNINKLENDLLDWGMNHPDHPAIDSFLTELIDNYQENISSRKIIAVILPLQGNLSEVTATIKNGILSAYYNEPDSLLKPIIKFYDNSNDENNFYELYQQARNDGATNVIGPLDKSLISQLAQQQQLDIPVLTLNYAENTLVTTENFFQFGLSPVDEARQVAELAISQNRRRAAVLYPDSEWGNRLRTAFTEHFIFLGGEVLTTSDYATTTNDYKRPIRALLNLDQSNIRRKKIENIIHKKTQSEPYRRQDVDMVFLAATHRSARSIMPALKFHHAGDLAVYSTSHVFTGNTDREHDRDLNGLIFCDLPWIINNNSELQTTFKTNWPQHQQLTRLYALGIDAYHLLYNLDYLKNKEYAFYDGQTGNISLDENNQVIRKSLWAKFVSGRAIQFEPEIEALATTTQNNNSQDEDETAQ